MTDKPIAATPPRTAADRLLETINEAARHECSRRNGYRHLRSQVSWRGKEYRVLEKVTGGMFRRLMEIRRQARLAIEAEAAPQTAPLDVERLAEAMVNTGQAENYDGTQWNPSTIRIVTGAIAAEYQRLAADRVPDAPEPHGHSDSCLIATNLDQGHHRCQCRCHDTACNCATYGNAYSCSIHTQADYLASDAATGEGESK